MRRGIAIAIVLTLGAFSAVAQESSLSARKRESDAAQGPKEQARVTVERKGNEVAEKYSWIAIKPKDPPTYKVHDLLTIIVREQRTFEADSELESKREYDVRSELDAMFKLTDGGLGATGFRRGKPTVDYQFETESKGEADTKREDRLVTRITGEIIDIKPNGILVVEARARVVHDEEVSTVTLTGKVRKEDVTPDNTVLSTQLADKDIAIVNEGELRSATRRGWIPKLIDLLRPI